MTPASVMQPAEADEASTPIPQLVNISVGDEDSAEDKPAQNLQYATSTPGTMPKIATFSSPLDFFTSPSHSANSPYARQPAADNDDTENENENDQEADENVVLGISNFTYGGHDSSDDDQSVMSHRIGITRTSYDVPDSEFPLSPMDLMLKKEQFKAIEAEKKEDDESQFDDAYYAKLYSLEIPSSPIQKYEIPGTAEITLPQDGIHRIVHPHTAKGQFLATSPAMDAPMDGMRYSLDKGRRSMTAAMRSASSSRLNTRYPKVKSMSAIVGPGVGENLESQFKIFVLLIQPKTKIFELIQILYSPSQTTVGDLLEKIPFNATEPALGSQSYSGLSRPRDPNGILLEEEQMASSAGPNGSAKITQGEILVAVPVGIPSPYCSKLSEPILSNKRLTKLLNKKDPLAPKRRKSSKKSKRSSRGTTRQSSMESLPEQVSSKNEGDENSSQVSNPLSLGQAKGASWTYGGPDCDDASQSSGVSFASFSPKHGSPDKNAKKYELMLQMATSCFVTLVGIYNLMEEEEEDPVGAAMEFLGLMQSLVMFYIVCKADEKKKSETDAEHPKSVFVTPVKMDSSGVVIK